MNSLLTWAFGILSNLSWYLKLLWLAVINIYSLRVLWFNYLEVIFCGCLLYCNLLCHAVLQALPYMRCIGESWPMTKERAYFEAVALRELGWLSPEHVPEVYHFGHTMSLIGMCYLEPPHIIVRKGLIAGIEYPLLAEHMSEFMARTLYFTSLLYRSTMEHKCAGVQTLICNFVLLLYLACIIWSSPLWVFISQYDRIFLGYIYNCNWLWFKFCKVTSIHANV